MSATALSQGADARSVFGLFHGSRIAVQPHVPLFLASLAAHEATTLWAALVTMVTFAAPYFIGYFVAWSVVLHSDRVRRGGERSIVPLVALVSTVLFFAATLATQSVYFRFLAYGIAFATAFMGTRLAEARPGASTIFLPLAARTTARRRALDVSIAEVLVPVVVVTIAAAVRIGWIRFGQVNIGIFVLLMLFATSRAARETRDSIRIWIHWSAGLSIRMWCAARAIRTMVFTAGLLTLAHVIGRTTYPLLLAGLFGFMAVGSGVVYFVCAVWTLDRGAIDHSTREFRSPSLSMGFLKLGIVALEGVCLLLVSTPSMTLFAILINLLLLGLFVLLAGRLPQRNPDLI